MKNEKGVIIKVENINKTFKLPHEKNTSIKNIIINPLRKRTFERQQVLKNINIDIKKGEFFGIIGRNGSGKSTLLKLMAGIYSPDSGLIHINGNLTPFIELGVGFNPELTGRENVYLNGALLGFNRKEMKDMYDEIVEFAEIKKFMDQKLKNYSSGMQVRLAFSIAIRVNTDILIIDEVLAVGDILFQEKCFQVFKNIKKSKTTVVFVSHDLNSLKEFCDRIAIIDRGKLVDIGDPSKMVMEYEALVAETEDVSHEEYDKHEEITKSRSRPGTGDYNIEKVEVINNDGKKAKHLLENESFTVRVYYRSNKNIPSFVCGISITDIDGVSLIGPNTKDSKFKLPGIKPQSEGYINAFFSTNLLSSGVYFITVGLFDSLVSKPLDYYEKAVKFKIIGGANHGKFNIEPKWSNHKTSR